MLQASSYRVELVEEEAFRRCAARVSFGNEVIVGRGAFEFAAA
jgi:hypothetical protein